MKTSPLGIAFITAEEGTRLTAYRDSVGVLTIGVGHTSNAGPPKVAEGMRISAAESAAIVATDLAKFEKRVADTLGSVPQTVFDGAVSFDFNTGAITKASWAKAYKAGDLKGAEARLKQWNKAGGKVLAGLTARRGREADLIFRGKYPAFLKPAASPEPVATPPARLPDPVTPPAPPVENNAPATRPATTAGQAAGTGAVAGAVAGAVGVGAAVVVAPLSPWVWVAVAAGVAVVALIIFLVIRNRRRQP